MLSRFRSSVERKRLIALAKETAPEGSDITVVASCLRKLADEALLFAWFRAALTSQPMPMTLVGLAIKLALMNGTRVFPSVRFDAPRFLGVPFAIRIVPANDLIGFGAAWNAFGSDSEAGAGEQYNQRGKEEGVLQG
jgi:hypothetical protein